MSGRHAKPYHHKVVVPDLCWGRRRFEFYAVTDMVSPARIRFHSATGPLVDEELICSIRHIGVVQTRVVGIGDIAFVVRVVARKQTVSRVARELRQLAQQQEATVPVPPRVTPFRTDVTIELADGRGLPARLLNVSTSSVAFTLDADIAIGRTTARVARYFQHGIDAVFDTSFAPRAVDRHITL